tara:strand:- start:269 stop:514 length:246 start_codon:yes stop_codon:yes gene_type:complete
MKNLFASPVDVLVATPGYLKKMCDEGCSSDHIHKYIYTYLAHTYIYQSISLSIYPSIYAKKFASPLFRKNRSRSLSDAKLN